ncbi:hypothetical protein MFFDBJGM_02472 [Pectobacterium versatile]|uniref:hypothetical protein n=1 Tax=Pectobacterium versatile TaxID=2488639 RepID=UPI000DAB386D|nr:hypothetical protein [Pectobacterium versatile]GBO49454.1 hypothetical protein MFFDBJGM_02472 [Pectobacterium versatile]
MKLVKLLIACIIAFFAIKVFFGEISVFSFIIIIFVLVIPVSIFLSIKRDKDSKRTAARWVLLISLVLIGCFVFIVKGMISEARKCNVNVEEFYHGDDALCFSLLNFASILLEKKDIYVSDYRILNPRRVIVKSVSNEYYDIQKPVDSDEYYFSVIPVKEKNLF